MKTIKYILLLLPFILIGCKKLESGIVLDKEYQPANTNLVLIPHTISTGKTTQTMLIPYYIYDNEDWVLTVKGFHDGKERIEHIYTSKECFESLSVGDDWFKTSDCNYSDKNNIKQRKR